MGLKANFLAQRAYSLHGKGQYEEALRVYEEAAAAGMDQPKFMLGYSVLLLRSGQYEKAREVLVKIQKLPGLTGEQKNQLFVNYAACVYRLGEIDKGIRLLERQHAHQPTGLVYQTLGYLYVAKYARENTPNFDALEAEAAAAAAQAAEETSETPAEEETVVEAVKYPSLETETALSPREAWAEGIRKTELFEKEAIEYDEEDAVCLDNMGQFLYRVQGDPEAARPWFDKAIAEKPGQIDTLWFLSRYDLENGDTAGALARLNKALEGRFSPLNYADKAMIEAEIARLKG